MCGIYGYSNLERKKRLEVKELENIISWLGVCNQSRGKDSTGIATVDTSNKYNIIKKTIPANGFFKAGRVKDFINYNVHLETKTIIGHTRFATTGKVNRLNAMPFKSGKILGSHNGMIWNYEELFKEHKIRPETKCDSEIIFALLNKFPATMGGREDALKLLDGVFALAWYDNREPNKMFFARQSNPLSIYKHLESGAIFWSSEEHVMQELNKLLGDTLTKIEISDNTILSIDDKGQLAYLVMPVYDYTKSFQSFKTLDSEESWNRPSKEYLVWQEKHEAKYNKRRGRCDNCRHKSRNLIHDPNFELLLCKACYKAYQEKYSDMLPESNFYNRHYYEDGYTN